MGSNQIFILSPANCSGRRAQILMREQAAFDLAIRLRETGAPIGEVFSFMSGLYFRGKMAYSTRFARPPAGHPGALVVAPGEGLVEVTSQVDKVRLQNLASVPVDLANSRYRSSLEESAARLAESTTCPVILLGSVASGKYVDILLAALGERLLFPIDFVGRGDMSRGGLMLRCVDAEEELKYLPIHGAVRRGQRPPRLEPRR